MIHWLKRLFALPPPPECPGCGTPLEQWRESRDHNGYREEMIWFGCPNYRFASYDESKKHSARWHAGKRTPLKDLENAP